MMMPIIKPLPASANALVVRTDFTDRAGWESACKSLIAPSDGEEKAIAEFCFVDDPAYDGLDAEQVAALLPGDSHPPVAVIVDYTATRSVEHLVLLVNLDESEEEFVRELRCIPEEVQVVVSSLDVGSMPFNHYAESAAADGVFRGH